ncbi:MAG: glucoamylase family protein, partial [Pseudonocardia sp.]
GLNHPLYVQGQIEHGLEEAGYGYWGFSPSNNPAGGYREYGVDQLGLDGPGYTSDQERTTVDQPYEGCRAGSPAPTEYGDGVVTPHASFLALRYAHDQAMANLAAIRTDFDAYGPGGFYDAVAVRSGQVSKRYLSLDQGMIMAALGNELAGDNMRDYVATGRMKRKLEPLMRMEEFSTGKVG